MKDFSQSPGFTRLIQILAVLFIALIIFWAGMGVGYRKAQFSFRWSDNYVHEFGGPRSAFMVMSRPINDATPNSHGAFGQVITINLPTLVVKGPSEPEKTIILNSNTLVKRFQNEAASTSIRVGDAIVVIGIPDGQGRVQATLVRILPPMPTSTPPAR